MEESNEKEITNENPEILNRFVDTIKEYVEIDDQIKAASKDLQLLKSRKTTLSVTIMGFMQNKQWEVCNISSGGKLMLKKSKTKQGIKKDDVNTKLKKYFDEHGDQKHIENVMKLIFEDREISEKDVLRRSSLHNKNK